MGGMTPHLSGKRNTILFVNQLPVNLGKVKTADVEISDTTFLVPGTTSSFTFAGKHYKLEAKAQGEDVYKNYTLLLNGERNLQRSGGGWGLFPSSVCWRFGWRWKVRPCSFFAIAL